MRLRSTSLSLRSTLSRFSKWGFASKVKELGLMANAYVPGTQETEAGEL